MTADGLVRPPPDVTWHRAVDRDARWRALGCQGATAWLTGLSGAGKSTVGAAVERVLLGRGVRAYLLDGDNLRHGLNRDLGFDRSARRENVRRIAEVACLLADSGAVAIVAAISPFGADRATARAAHVGAGLRFVEVFVDAPLAVCEERDPKGLYQAARAGRIASFTGVHDAYERPRRPDVHVRTDRLDVAACAAAVLRHLGGAKPDGDGPPRGPGPAS